MRSAPAVLAAVLILAGVTSASGQQVSTNPSAVPAGNYVLDPAHTSVTLKISHFGLSHYTLRFDKVSGSYAYDPGHPTATQIQVAIDPKSIDTGNPIFDREISGQFFDAVQYPKITFVSTAVRPSAGNRGQVVGDLTLHGVTKPVTLNVTFNGAGRGVLHEERMGFSATAVVRRSDFGVKQYLPIVGDEVAVQIETEFARR